MPAPVVLVHRDRDYLTQAAEALRAAGLPVAAFSDSMAALNALQRTETSEVLVTVLSFPNGMPNGLSLALVAKGKRPGLKILFLAEPELVRHVEQQTGTRYLPTITPPVDSVVSAVEEMMARTNRAKVHQSAPGSLPPLGKSKAAEGLSITRAWADDER